MADVCDNADRLIEVMVTSGIANSRNQKSLVAVGFCHNCGEPVSVGKLFCDKDCMTDYENEQAARKRNGR